MSFSKDYVPVVVPERKPTFFEQLDTNGDGTLSEDEGVMTLTGGTDLGTGEPNAEPYTILSGYGLTDYAKIANATVFIDQNGNHQRDQGEFSVTTNAAGAYDFWTLIETFKDATPAAVLGGLAPFDVNRNGAIDEPEGQLVLTSGVNVKTGEAETLDTVLPMRDYHGFTDRRGPSLCSCQSQRAMGRGRTQDAFRRRWLL